MTSAGLMVGCNNGESAGSNGSVARPVVGKGKAGDEGREGGDERDWSWSP